MADVKLTKNELRNQQNTLSRLEKYLPTLQLKKAMLQAEVHETRIEIERFEKGIADQREKTETFSSLLTTKITINPLNALHVKKLVKHYENIAGVEVPRFDHVEFEELDYSLFETPPWVDPAIAELRKLASMHEHLGVLHEQKMALERELREVSIRVNLFEKILIPRAVENIRTIKVFLGDQQLAAVSRAKVAKTKIEERKLAAFPKSPAARGSAYA